MKILVEDASTFPADIPMPEDGVDARTAASLEATIQKLTDRSANHETRLTDVEGFLGDVTLDVPLAPTVNQAGPSTSGTPHFDWSSIVFARGLNQTDTSGAGYLVFPLPPLPPGAATIVSVTVYVRVFTGRAGLPATKPTIYFSHEPLTTGVAVEVSQADAPANLAAYETAHSWTLTINHAIAADEQYWLIFRGETGANAQDTGLTLLALRLAVSP